MKRKISRPLEVQMNRNAVLKVTMAAILVVGVLLAFQPLAGTSLASELALPYSRGERFGNEGFGVAKPNPAYGYRMGERFGTEGFGVSQPAPGEKRATAARFDSEALPAAALSTGARFDGEPGPQMQPIATPRFDDE